MEILEQCYFCSSEETAFADVTHALGRGVFNESPYQMLVITNPQHYVILPEMSPEVIEQDPNPQVIEPEPSSLRT